MRTTKRFSEAVLKRFRSQKRGIGVFEHFTSWHQVTRGDPASSGRSHIVTFGARQVDLLSDSERIPWLLASMHPELSDLRTQFPHSLLAAAHELSAYDVSYLGKSYPGTLDLATELGIKHASLGPKGEKTHWVDSTDVLATLKRCNGALRLIAISSKPDLVSLTKRKRQLLALQRQYWIARDETWLLITPDQYDKRVSDTLVRSYAWGLGQCESPELIEAAVKTTFARVGHPYRTIIEEISRQCTCEESAKRAFWQGVWTSQIPLDLRMSWRPSAQVWLLPLTAFHDLNPVIAGRSAWI